MVESESDVDAHRGVIQRLLPDEESLDAQRPVMTTWVESLEDHDVVWCVGRTAGAYALLAAERVGEDRVVAFQPDATRRAAVRTVLDSAGHGAVTVEPLTVPTWQTPDLRAEEAITAGSQVDDPVQAMVAAPGTPDRPTVLTVDVPGYGAQVLSSFDGLDASGVRMVVLKTSDTLATTDLEDAGFETTLVAARRSNRAPWRRAVVASRESEAVHEFAGERARPTSDQPPGASDAVSDSSESGPSATTDGPTVGDWRRRSDGDAWQVRDVVALVPALVLSALSGLFGGIAVVLQVLAKIPGFGRVFANAMIGVIVAILFGAFLVLAVLVAELTGPLGVSDQAAAGVAGAFVVALPVLGALGFVWLAITTRTGGR